MPIASMLEFLGYYFGNFYSRNVKRFVCSMFMALVASYASITQEILISLAPFHLMLVS